MGKRVEGGEVGLGLEQCGGGGYIEVSGSQTPHGLDRKSGN